MNISVGVMAYNEGSNIKSILEALLKQKTKNVHIKEIIVVSSGSTDNTNEIIKRFSKKNSKIKIILENKRRGKSHAINLFLKKAKSKILVLESADTIPKKNTIETLCSKLTHNIGIVSGRPIPKKTKGIINNVVQLQWRLHHEISKENPKFGEIIVFRKIKSIPQTIVDEEEIASIIKKQGYTGTYEGKAIVYNKGPETIKDFIRQRRRIYCGHLELRKRKDYEASSMKKALIIKKLFKEKNLIIVTLAMTLEGIGRTLGLLDYIFKKNHSIWKIAKTTKKIK